MPKKKTIELVQTESLPAALIIGGNHFATSLAAVLKDHGCAVRLADSPSSDLGRFDYIFQFGNFNLVDNTVKQHLLPSGKFLFLETDLEPNLSKKEGVRIIRIGDLLLWNKEELVDKILRTMFSSRPSSLVDVHKKSYFTSQTPPKKRSVPPVRPKILVKEPPVEAARKTRIIKKGRVFAFGLMILVILLLGIGVIYWYLFSLRQTASFLRSHLASSNWQALSSDVKRAKQQLHLTKKVYDFSSSLFFFLSNTAVFQDTGSALAAADDFLSAADDFLSFSTGIFARNPSFFSSRDRGITKTELLLLEDKIEALSFSVTSAKKELERVNVPFFQKENFILLLAAASEKLIAAREVLPIAEKLFFEEQPKIYLVLFQNNMELRPTGGFIGSFALLAVENGKIVDFKIEDVYTADGQLKGHVDPPAPIRKYLSQPHFFLRDSNFDPDFAASALRASWFLEKELGPKVDGVIGVNLLFVQKLLRVAGTLTLPDFNNEKVNSDNFFFKAHSFSGQNFFPGSTQKKDFLTSVANALMEELSITRRISWLDLFAVVKEALEEKNILIFLEDENGQKFIEEKGWGGRMVEVKCLEEKKENKCLSDYLSVVEANLGVNKANYFVSKSVTIEKKIEGGDQITSLVTLAYENAALPEVFPEATYVDYLRIFVPKESKLGQVTFNNTSLADADVDFENYGPDKTVFGFLVKIAPGNRGVVKIAYTLPYSFDKEISSSQFFFQKQGGDKNSPLVLSITFPPELKLKPLNFKSTSGREGEIFYTTDTSVDRIFAFEVDH